ncbi:MAG: cysteine hydrolase [bacterium]|nr:cysteine hydrolase [bacterium]
MSRFAPYVKPAAGPFRTTAQALAVILATTLATSALTALTLAAALAAVHPARAAEAAAEAPAPLTALVIIDIQDFYFPGGALPLVAPEAAGANAAKLLAQARAHGKAVIHVGHNAKAGRAFHADVQPRDGELVVMKDDVNAFLKTNLQTILQSGGFRRLVVCGMQTHMCVEAATRAAADFGYEVLLAGDACATRDLQHGDVTVPAAQVHATTLATLDRTYGKVVSMDEAMGALQ